MLEYKRKTISRKNMLFLLKSIQQQEPESSAYGKYYVVHMLSKSHQLVQGLKKWLHSLTAVCICIVCFNQREGDAKLKTCQSILALS